MIYRINTRHEERTHVDLFSGLGCWAITARANGVRTVAMCEREEWLAAGLERTWGCPCYRDVKEFPAEKYRGVWLLTGSPPCQPASRAGKQRGAGDDRWLWDPTIRICEVIQPAWFCFENPPGILDVGIDGILSDLEGVGYEVQPIRIPACAVDSPQDRDRVWILGHRAEPGRKGSDAAVSRRGPNGASESTQGAVADSQCLGWKDHQWIACPDRDGALKVRRAPTGLYDLAHGAQSRIPRKFHSKLIAALGNAIVWQVADQIIKALIEAER